MGGEGSDEEVGRGRSFSVGSIFCSISKKDTLGKVKPYNVLRMNTRL